MNKTVKMVNELSDSQVVAVTKELFERIYSEIPYNDVSANFDSVAEVAPLISLEETALRRELTTEQSARLGRLVLVQYAHHESLEPLVQKSIEKVRGFDDLIVDLILAVGLIINLTLLIATTKVSVETGPGGQIRWLVSKGVASPELVKAVVEPVVDMAKAVG